MDPPNVVLIVLDTLRRDIPSAFGGGASTPNMAQLVEEGVEYDNCVAPAPWTVPSHASIFTGAYPTRHGVHETFEKKNPETFGMMGDATIEPLPVYLRRRGYNTVGFSANPSIAPGSGFDRGFNAFTLVGYEPVPEARSAMDRASRYGRSRSEIAFRLLTRGKLVELYRLYRLERRVRSAEAEANYPLVKGGGDMVSRISESSFEEPFFLFANLMEAHGPYVTGLAKGETNSVKELFGSSTLDGRRLARVKRSYSRGVEVEDGFVGGILRHLKESGAWDRTMVILTSDHGHSFKERGYYGHGTFLYDEIVRVPLVVKYPGGRRPKPRKGYQTLARVPEAIKDSGVGINDGLSLSSDVVYSESFGIAGSLRAVQRSKTFEETRAKYDRPRKAVYKGGWKLVVEGKEGTVEEFSRGSKEADPTEYPEVVSELREGIRALEDKSFVAG